MKYKAYRLWTNLDICNESWDDVDSSIESWELKIAPDGDGDTALVCSSWSQTDGWVISLLFFCFGFAFTAVFALLCFRTTPLFACFFFPPFSPPSWLKVALKAKKKNGLGRQNQRKAIWRLPFCFQPRNHIFYRKIRPTSWSHLRLWCLRTQPSSERGHYRENLRLNASLAQLVLKLSAWALHFRPKRYPVCKKSRVTKPNKRKRKLFGFRWNKEFKKTWSNACHLWPWICYKIPKLKVLSAS